MILAQPPPRIPKLPGFFYLLILIIILGVGGCAIALPTVLIVNTQRVDVFTIALLVIGALMVALFVSGVLGMCTTKTIFPRIFFYISTTFDIILFIISTLFCFSSSVRASIIGGLTQTIGCPSTDPTLEAICKFLAGINPYFIIIGVLMFICCIILLFCVVVSAYLQGFRKTISTTIGYGGVWTILFGTFIAFLSMYQMIFSLKRANWLLIIEFAVGLAMMFTGVFILVSGKCVKDKKILLVCFIIVVAVCALTMMFGIVGWIQEENVAITFAKSQMAVLCNVAWCNTTLTQQCFYVINSTTVGKQCCAFIGVELDSSNQCMVGRSTEDLQKLFIATIRSSVFPVSTSCFYISLYLLWVGFCVFVYRHKMEEWRLMDIQDIMIKKGGMLTDDDLKKIGKTKQEMNQYLPTKAGKSLYVFDHLSTVHPNEKKGPPRKTESGDNDDDSIEEEESDDSDTESRSEGDVEKIGPALASFF